MITHFEKEFELAEIIVDPHISNDLEDLDKATKQINELRFDKIDRLVVVGDVIGLSSMNLEMEKFLILFDRVAYLKYLSEDVIWRIYNDGIQQMSCE